MNASRIEKYNKEAQEEIIDNNEMHKYADENGFEIWPSGGGIDLLTKEMANGTTFVVSHEDGSAPLAGEPAMVGVQYSEEECDGFLTAEDAIRQVINLDCEIRREIRLEAMLAKTTN